MKHPEQIFTAIARKHLFIETLETRRSDRLDFHDVSVWAVRNALAAAYEAGRENAARDLVQSASNKVSMATREVLAPLDPDARLREAAPAMRDTLLYVAQELAAFKPDYLRQVGLNVALEQVEKAMAIADGTPAPASAATEDDQD
jgi:hypothetical protein